MSCRVKKYASTLQVLSRAKPKVKRMVIAKADKQFMDCLCECGKKCFKRERTANVTSVASSASV